MIVYGIMLTIALLFAYLNIKTEDKKKKIIYLILMMLPFILVSGLRYGVGTDFFFRYDADYRTLSDGRDVGNLEIGFKIFMKVCLIFSKNSQILFIITSILISFFMIYGINKTSKNLLISILIFVIGGFFFQSLNLVRQFLAMAMIFFGYQYLLEKDKIKWYLLICVLAFFIHSSSIIMIGLIFCRKKIIFKPWITLSIIAVIFLFSSSILDILTPFIENTRFEVYLIGKYAKPYTSHLYNLVNLVIYAFIVILYQVKIKNDKTEEMSEEMYVEDKLLLNIQALALIFTVMSNVHMLFSRMSYYFTIFQILSIPYFIETTIVKNFKFKVKTKKVKLEMKKLKSVLYTLVIIGFLSLTFYTNILHNDNEPIPYMSIFNKERKIY